MKISVSRKKLKEREIHFWYHFFPKSTSSNFVHRMHWSMQFEKKNMFYQHTNIQVSPEGGPRGVLATLPLDGQGRQKIVCFWIFFWEKLYVFVAFRQKVCSWPPPLGKKSADAHGFTRYSLGVTFQYFMNSKTANTRYRFITQVEC